RERLRPRPRKGGRSSGSHLTRMNYPREDGYPCGRCSQSLSFYRQRSLSLRGINKISSTLNRQKSTTAFFGVELLIQIDGCNGAASLRSHRLFRSSHWLADRPEPRSSVS